MRYVLARYEVVIFGIIFKVGLDIDLTHWGLLFVRRDYLQLDIPLQI